VGASERASEKFPDEHRAGLLNVWMMSIINYSGKQ